MNILEKAYQKHKTWLNICRSFGLDNETAKDIVSEMYLKLQDITEKGTDITYGKDDINYYYIFKILYTMFLQLKKKQSRVRFVDEDVLKHIEGPEEVEYAVLEKKFNDEFDKLHWYDQKVFEIIASGTKISVLSRKTTITYISLYNTYRNVKKMLKKKMGL